jgi:ribonuclease-3
VIRIAPPSVTRYGSLEERLGYRFRDALLLEQAFTHKSFVNESTVPGRQDNQRLEFLGDAVLDLAVSHALMEMFPGFGEGDLTKIRAGVVNEQGLARVAEELRLGEWLFLGRGEEQSGGRRKPSLLADAFEALVAAVYLDGGYDPALAMVRRLLGARLAVEAGQMDFKTRLQERTQTTVHETPRYQLVSESGPAHDRSFEVAVLLGGQELSRGRGKSKKEAEQRAAAGAFEVFESVGFRPLAARSGQSRGAEASDGEMGEAEVGTGQAEEAEVGTGQTEKAERA